MCLSLKKRKKKKRNEIWLRPFECFEIEKFQPFRSFTFVNLLYYIYTTLIFWCEMKGRKREIEEF